jgi:hypothetical protein
MAGLVPLEFHASSYNISSRLSNKDAGLANKETNEFVTTKDYSDRLLAFLISRTLSFQQGSLTFDSPSVSA